MATRTKNPPPDPSAPQAPVVPSAEHVLAQIRVRNKTQKVVPADTLTDHPLNWRKHPAPQRRALAAVLEQIGFVGVALTRPDPEDPSKYQLIDGHLRKDLMKGQLIPIVVTDLDDEETATLLATHDPIASMAEMDSKNMLALQALMPPVAPDLLPLLNDLSAMATVQSGGNPDLDSLFHLENVKALQQPAATADAAAPQAEPQPENPNAEAQGDDAGGPRPDQSTQQPENVTPGGQDAGQQSAPVPDEQWLQNVIVGRVVNVLCPHCLKEFGHQLTSLPPPPEAVEI